MKVRNPNKKITRKGRIDWKERFNKLLKDYRELKRNYKRQGTVLGRLEEWASWEVSSGDPTEEDRRQRELDKCFE